MSLGCDAASCPKVAVLFRQIARKLEADEAAMPFGHKATWDVMSFDYAADAIALSAEEMAPEQFGSDDIKGAIRCLQGRYLDLMGVH